MHTGLISFADRIVYNIKSNDIKDLILEQLYTLYNIKIIQKHYHKINEDNIKYIISNPHLCNLRSNGNPYYIFFTLYNDIPIIYFIDKKIHPGYQKPRILLVRGLFDKKIFDNTLLDGEMVKCKDGKWQLLLNDIIVYQGLHLIKKKLPERLDILYNMFSTQYTSDPIIDVCQYKIKRYYYVYKESIKELIKLSDELCHTCRGIYLWSYDLKYKPKLYNFNEENIINVVRKVKDHTEFKLSNEIQEDIKTNKNVKIEKIDNSTILWLAQTEYPDVYNLYESNNMLTSKNIGTALIPTLAISAMVRNAFKGKNAVSLLKAQCLFNTIFNKWYPLEII